MIRSISLFPSLQVSPPWGPCSQGPAYIVLACLPCHIHSLTCFTGVARISLETTSLNLSMPSPETFSDSLLSLRRRPNPLPWLSQPSQAVLSLPVLADPNTAPGKPSTPHRHLPNTWPVLLRWRGSCWIPCLQCLLPLPAWGSPPPGSGPLTWPPWASAFSSVQCARFGGFHDNWMFSKHERTLKTVIMGRPLLTPSPVTQHTAAHAEEQPWTAVKPLGCCLVKTPACTLHNLSRPRCWLWHVALTWAAVTGLEFQAEFDLTCSVWLAPKPNHIPAEALVPSAPWGAGDGAWLGHRLGSPSPSPAQRSLLN